MIFSLKKLLRAKRRRKRRRFGLFHRVLSKKDLLDDDIRRAWINRTFSLDDEYISKYPNNCALIDKAIKNLYVNTSTAKRNEYRSDKSRSISVGEDILQNNNNCNDVAELNVTNPKQNYVTSPTSNRYKYESHKSGINSATDDVLQHADIYMMVDEPKFVGETQKGYTIVPTPKIHKNGTTDVVDVALQESDIYVRVPGQNHYTPCPTSNSGRHKSYYGMDPTSKGATEAELTEIRREYIRNRRTAKRYTRLSTKLSHCNNQFSVIPCPNHGRNYGTDKMKEEADNRFVITKQPSRCNYACLQKRRYTQPVQKKDYFKPATKYKIKHWISCCSCHWCLNGLVYHCLWKDDVGYNVGYNVGINWERMCSSELSCSKNIKKGLIFMSCVPFLPCLGVHFISNAIFQKINF